MELFITKKEKTAEVSLPEAVFLCLRRISPCGDRDLYGSAAGEMRQVKKSQKYPKLCSAAERQEWKVFISVRQTKKYDRIKIMLAILQ